MQLSKQSLKRWSGRQQKQARVARVRSARFECAIQALEKRQLLSASGEYIENPIPPVLANSADPSANAITLNQYFNDTTLPGTLVTFTTTEGSIQVALTDAATPQTVANFLSYVESGAYTDTIFHRSVDLTDGASASPTDPGTIIQGGGYNISNGGLAEIPTNTPVDDEYTTELYGDVAGTLAMAKTSYANSATSQWYFNVTDNTELDTPTTDPNGVTTSYTVFGKVLSGTDVISTIAALPTDNLGSGLDSVPVSGLTEAQIQAGASLSANNLVFVEDVTAEAGTSYTVSSDNTSLVTPKVTNGVLSFTYGSGFGTANVTITGDNLDGTSASTTLLVTVPNPAAPSAGPTAANFTAPFTVTGTTGTFSVLGGSTDSVAALNPATLQIISPPAHGTVSVNSADGLVSYTPDAGYVGPDTLTFTVADSSGTVSNPATVTLDAVPTAVTVTVGANGVKKLNFIQPNGLEGHMGLINGSALVTFADYRVTLSGPDASGTLTASGAGATIASVAVTDRGTNAELDVTSSGPVTIGSVTDNLHLSIKAPTSILTGNCSTGASQFIYVAALDNVNFNIGISPVATNLFVNSVTDSNIVSGTGFLSVESTQWLNTDNGSYSITAPYISFLGVKGTFDENLNLSSKGYDIFFAKLNTAGGQWNCAGSVFKAQLNPTSNWYLSVNGLLKTLDITGNLDNTIEAAAIGTMVVKGTTTNSTIETSAGYSKKALQIGNVTFDGAVSQSVIFAVGNIGSITAQSFSDSRVYAGVATSVAENGSLAASASDLTDDAKINSITLKTAGSGFTDSLISADMIGTLKLGKIDTSTAPTGISAHQISAVQGTLVPGGILNANAAALKSQAALTAYLAKKKLTLGDFEINLF
jgi:peptidyl-prolyl cis-trans isomerase A (cyclophilin A)